MEIHKDKSNSPHPQGLLEHDLKLNWIMGSAPLSSSTKIPSFLSTTMLESVKLYFWNKTNMEIYTYVILLLFCTRKFKTNKQKEQLCLAPLAYG